MIVALAVMLAVPVAQLRFIYIENSCCCPLAKRCHCPDHDPGTSGQPSMRPCHREPRVIATPAMPGFVPAPDAELAAPVGAAATATFEIERPHAPPPPRRPDAPS